MRILLIEDNAGICFAVEMFLQLEGHSAISVDSGEAGLVALAQEEFDLILLDLNTNGMSAQQFVLEMRDLIGQRGFGLPVLGVLSGSASIELEARRLKADFSMRKPFDTEDLIKIIAHVQPRGLSRAKFIAADGADDSDLLSSNAK